MLTQTEWRWFKERTSVNFMEDTVGIIAYETNDESILGCCVADDFGVDNCNAHIALDNPMVLRKGFLNEVAEWLFVGNERLRIFAWIPSSNHKSLKFAQNVGFTKKCVIEHGNSEGIDTVVMVMHRDDCPWLDEGRRVA